MQKLIHFTLMGLLLLIGPTWASADQAAPESPLDTAIRLQQRYDKIISLSFTFHQDTRGEMTGRPRKGSGRAVFFRDGQSNQMRWDYLAPDRQILISDGEKFSMYFANLQQMIVTPAENLDAELTYAFFTGRGNLVEDFQIFPPEDELTNSAKKEISTIKLIPKKPQSQVQDIHLWVTQDSLLRRLHIRDHFGTITVLNFSNIEINNLAKKSAQQVDELFSFSPPEDTEIIYQ